MTAKWMRWITVDDTPLSRKILDFFNNIDGEKLKQGEQISFDDMLFEAQWDKRIMFDPENVWSLQIKLIGYPEKYKEELERIVTYLIWINRGENRWNGPPGFTPDPHARLHPERPRWHLTTSNATDPPIIDIHVENPPNGMLDALEKVLHEYIPY